MPGLVKNRQLEAISHVIFRIFCGIRYTSCPEPLGPKATGVTDPTGGAIVIKGITGHGFTEIDAQIGSDADNIGLAHPDQGGLDPEPLPFHAGLGRQVGKPLEGLYELRTAIRVTRVVNRVGAYINVLGPQDLGPAERHGQEYRISGRYVCDRYTLLGLLRNVDILVGERRAPHPANIQPGNTVLVRSQETGYLGCGFQLPPMSLAVVKRQRMAAKTPVHRHGQHGSGIQATRDQHHGITPSGHARHPKVIYASAIATSPANDLAVSIQPVHAGIFARRTGKTR